MGGAFISAAVLLVQLMGSKFPDHAAALDLLLIRDLYCLGLSLSKFTATRAGRGVTPDEYAVRIETKKRSLVAVSAVNCCDLGPASLRLDIKQAVEERAIALQGHT